MTDITVAVLHHRDTGTNRVLAWAGFLPDTEVMARLADLFSRDGDPWSEDDTILFYDVDIHPAVRLYDVGTNPAEEARS